MGARANSFLFAAGGGTAVLKGWGFAQVVAEAQLEKAWDRGQRRQPV